MNWLDFRNKIINCHVEMAIVVVSFFFILHVQGLLFPLFENQQCMNFNYNFFYIFMA